MPPRKKPTLLARGKPRTLGGNSRPWRVRLYAPDDGGTKYQVMFRAPAGEGEPWKRGLRRASSEEEARKIFAQAEAALDTEQATLASARVKATQTIAALRTCVGRCSISAVDIRWSMACRRGRTC